MKFKKLLTVLGIVLISTSLTACGDTTTKSGNTSKKETTSKTTSSKKESKEESLTGDEKTLKEIVEATYFGNYEVKERTITEGYDGKDKRINLLLEAKSVKESLELSQAKHFIDYVFADIPDVKTIYIGILENGNKKISLEIDKETFDSIDWIALNPEDLPNLLGEKYYFKN